MPSKEVVDILHTLTTFHLYVNATAPRGGYSYRLGTERVNDLSACICWACETQEGMDQKTCSRRNGAKLSNRPHLFSISYIHVYRALSDPTHIYPIRAQSWDAERGVQVSERDAWTASRDNGRKGSDIRRLWKWPRWGKRYVRWTVCSATNKQAGQTRYGSTRVQAIPYTSRVRGLGEGCDRNTVTSFAQPSSCTVAYVNIISLLLWYRIRSRNGRTRRFYIINYPYHNHGICIYLRPY